MRRQGSLSGGLTTTEYLAAERGSPEKHEFYCGEVFAMAGASRSHNLIVANLLRELSSALRERPCEVYASDMRVRVQRAQLYTYPDVVVVCGEPQFEDDQSDTLANPTVIVEVLSDSTEAYDRGKKFEMYRTLSSLSDYVLVSQDEALIERFARQPDGTWSLTEAVYDGKLPLSIGCALAVAEVYLKVPLNDPSRTLLGPNATR